MHLTTRITLLLLYVMINIESINRKNLKSRDIFPSILPWVDEPECILILGTRQAGKTSLFYLLVQHLYQNNVLSDENLCFLDIEDPADLELADSGPDNLLSALKLKGKNWKREKPLFLFFDEVHLLDNPARLIKLLVDHHPDVRLFATGSSSTRIRKKFSDALPGRKQEFFLSTLNFGEYLEFGGKGNLRHSLFSMDDLFGRKPGFFSQELIDIVNAEVQKEFDQFMIYGGYPRIVLTVDAEKKKRRLGAIFNDYVRKDIGTLFSIEHLNEFTRLVKILAAQTGGLLTYAHLASALGLNQRTIGRYLDILESTFILTRLLSYQATVKKRLVKAPKLYFYDNGIRNMALGDFAAAANRADIGALVENAVFQFLRGKVRNPDAFDPAFWRTSSGAEVDFIFDNFLIEVKSGAVSGNASRAVYSCMSDTGIRKALVLNRNRVDRIKDNRGEVVFFPYSLLN